MNFVDILEVFNYCLILLFGVFLSMNVAGGLTAIGQKITVFVLAGAFLAAQGVGWFVWGTDTVRFIYPVLIHLPIILVLVLVLKKPVGVAIVSVCTAYLCCQLPRWVNLVSFVITKSELVEQITYTLFIGVIYYLLSRFFTKAAYHAMTYSTRTLLLFGSLPVAYYLFDYATAVYSDMLYSGIKALNEFLPTATIIFYIIFVAAYHVQTQNRLSAENQRAAVESSLRQAEVEMEVLHRSASQTAIYRHDMRHHLNMLDGMLSSGNSEQARQYIKKVHSDIEAVSQKRFCENEAINLLCSYFTSKADKGGIELSVYARIPKDISIPDTELCSLLSNGLENAIHALEETPSLPGKVDLYCEVKDGKLLIEIKNPCKDNIQIKDGIPISSQEGHGYGCQSICAITEKHGGLCEFAANGGVFSLRVILPV